MLLIETLWKRNRVRNEWFLIIRNAGRGSLRRGENWCHLLLLSLPQRQSNLLSSWTHAWGQRLQAACLHPVRSLLSSFCLGFSQPWEARRSSGAEPGRLDGAGPSGAHIIAQLCLHHTAKVYVQENEALCAWKTSDMTALCCELCAVVQLLVKVPEQILLEPRGSSVY